MPLSYSHADVCGMEWSMPRVDLMNPPSESYLLWHALGGFHCTLWNWG